MKKYWENFRKIQSLSCKIFHFWARLEKIRCILYIGNYVGSMNRASETVEIFQEIYHKISFKIEKLKSELRKIWRSPFADFGKKYKNNWKLYLTRDFRASLFNVTSFSDFSTVSFSLFNFSWKFLDMPTGLQQKILLGL